MSNRQAFPAKDALKTWRQSVDSAILALQQRPQGAPNGLIVPGGGGGTWKALALTGWIPLALDGQHDPMYTIDADGFVHLRGLVTHATSWPTGTIATMPAGYGNHIDEYFQQPVYNGTTVGVAVLNMNNGILGLPVAATIAWGGTGWIGLSGITYYAGGQ